MITFGPDGLTGHDDHRAVARWTAAAVRRVCPGARLLCPALTPEMADGDRDINDRFDVYQPGLPVTHDPSELALDLALQGAWLDLKIAALQAHTSQTAALIERHRGGEIPTLGRTRAAHRSGELPRRRRAVPGGRTRTSTRITFAERGSNPLLGAVAHCP